MSAKKNISNIQKQNKIDFKPTKKKIILSFILSLPLSFLFFLIFHLRINKGISNVGMLSPDEFHLVYVIPILSFLFSYFFVSWLICHNVKVTLVK